MFLSGYLIDISNINIKEFYKKRIIRVLIPYTIWTILYTTVGSISSGISLKRYIYNFITAESTPTMYYIFVYIQFVLLTPLLAKLLKKKYWYLGFVVAPISFNKLLLMIGNYSFGIYISHCMVLAFLEKLIPFWSSIPFGINTVIVLFTTILCIIIGKKICGDKISKYLDLY